jgi:hypothetical protein
MTVDQAIASLQAKLLEGDKISFPSKTWSGGGFKAEAVRKILQVQNSQNELFDAASAMLDYQRKIPVKLRPISLFNRLEDALNSVREAHQIDPD